VQVFSASLPVFLNTANELLDKLGQDRSDTAMALSRELQKLTDTFRAWELSPPETHERASTVRSLLDVQRQVMEYLSKSKSPASSDAPPGTR
jgi:hypothetical protein